jgi:hypothetical protein
MVDVNTTGMEVEKEPPPEPAFLFHSNIAEFWESIHRHSPSQDKSSTEIWNGIKWTMSMSITKGTQFYDLVTITGKYTFDESWTEAFATARNAEEWKKQLTEHIHSTASEHYKIKIDIAGSKRNVGVKGEGTIIVTITWSPPVPQ